MARTRTLTRILIQISTGLIGSGLGSVLAPSEAQRRLLLEAANAQLRLGGSMLAACWSSAAQSVKQAQPQPQPQSQRRRQSQVSASASASVSANPPQPQPRPRASTLRASAKPGAILHLHRGGGSSFRNWRNRRRSGEKKSNPIRERLGATRTGNGPASRGRNVPQGTSRLSADGLQSA